MIPRGRSPSNTVRPLTIQQSAAFLPQQSAVELIETYALTRGMPAYLAQCGWRIYYALFSRSGFPQPLLDRASADPAILLFDPAMVIAAEA